MSHLKRNVVKIVCVCVMIIIGILVFMKCHFVSGSDFKFIKDLENFHVAVVDFNYNFEPLDSLDESDIMSTLQKSEIRSLFLENRFSKSNSMNGSIETMQSMIVFAEDVPIYVIYFFDSNMIEVDDLAEETSDKFYAVYNNDLFFDDFSAIVNK